MDVLNIPVEPEKSVSVLRRVPSSTSMIMVRLKRKLMYRGHVYSQNIRPQKIMDALYILQHTLGNPLYADIAVNESWQRDSNADSPELWGSLTSALSTQTDGVPSNMAEGSKFLIFKLSYL